MNKRNFITGIVVLAFFALFYVYSGQLQPAAALWPRIICMAGMVLSAANIVISGVKWKQEQSQTAVFPLNPGQIKRGLMLTALTAIWIFLLSRVGFLVSSMVFTAIIILIFEPVKDKKHYIRDIVVTVIFSVLLFAMFSLLGIRFPRGILI
ncbi:tripartite tricarboxylate transporter TctB family protein [Lawsonibacter sp. LCP25S3_G6]|uniref:tripartite tricarboxylate transporter TctB family protein n=1 Tax=unclassified Lawsonibacter TaxID=2617946 RepID=UPI003F9E3A2F